MLAVTRSKLSRRACIAARAEDSESSERCWRRAAVSCWARSGTAALISPTPSTTARRLASKYEINYGRAVRAMSHEHLLMASLRVDSVTATSRRAERMVARRRPTRLGALSNPEAARRRWPATRAGCHMRSVRRSPARAATRRGRQAPHCATGIGTTRIRRRARAGSCRSSPPRRARRDAATLPARYSRRQPESPAGA